MERRRSGQPHHHGNDAENTQKRVTVPIHPQFATWLEKQTRGIGKAPVFPTLAGKAGGGKSGLSMAFRRIMEHADIKGRLLREANGEGRSQSSLSFHSLRSRFTSAMANAGVASRTTAEAYRTCQCRNERAIHASRAGPATCGDRQSSGYSASNDAQTFTRCSFRLFSQSPLS